MRTIFMNVANSCYTLPEYDTMSMSGGGMLPSIFMGQLNPFLFAQNAFKFGGMSWGSNGIFNGWGNMGWGNMVCNYWNPCVQPGGGISSPSSPSSTSKAGKDKYDALKKLLDSYASYRITVASDDSCKDRISEIAKSKDSYTTKYENLKEIYNEISSSEPYKSFLKDKASAIKLSNGESLENTLIEIGYNESDGADAYATKIIDGVFNETLDDLLSQDNKIQGINVINVIRNYNTKNDKNFISELAKKYNNARGEEKTQYEDVIREVTARLLEEAKKAADSLETDNKFYGTLNTLEQQSIVSNGKVNDNFIKEFNKVYAYTRVLKAKAVDKMYSRTFGIGETTTFADATVEALKEENGIKKGDVEAAGELEVKYHASLDNSTTTVAKSVKECQKNNDAQGAIDIMTDKNCTLKPVEEEITVVGSDGTETPYEKRYEERYGNDKLTYIVVTTDEGTEIHKVTIQQDGKWKDEGKIEDWQKDINVKLNDAKLDATSKKEDSDKKKANLDKERDSERKIMNAAFGSYRESNNKATIGGEEYYVYAVRDKVENKYKYKFYCIKDNKICRIKPTKGGLNLDKNNNFSMQDGTEVNFIEYKDPKAENVAKYISKQLVGPTNDIEWKNFHKLMESDNDTVKEAGGSLNEENVMYMIAYYNANHDCNLFKQIMNEGDKDKGDIGGCKKQCMKLIKLIIKYVENHGGEDKLKTDKAKTAYSDLKAIADPDSIPSGDDLDKKVKELLNCYEIKAKDERSYPERYDTGIHR